ncbi:MAG: hypothetical protein V4511_03030 [Bacteroidota bacterium]
MRTELVLFIEFKDITEETESDKVTGSKLYPQKAEFDSLSYEEKISFWEANEAYSDCWRYEVMKGKEKRVFSIIPNGDIERGIYISWRIQLIKDMFKGTPHHGDWLKMCDYDAIVKDYYSKTANDENSFVTIEYCKSQIKKHKEQLGSMTPDGLLITSALEIGYKYSNSKTNLSSVSTIFDSAHFDFEGLLTGMNCAKLIPFYQTEIEIKKGLKPQQTRTGDDYKTKAWFLVGILFATGEMDNLQIQFNKNATQIAKHLYNDRWEKYRPYIGESASNTNDTDKNIFKRPQKLMDIYNHCIENDITMTEAFKTEALK